MSTSKTWPGGGTGATPATYSIPAAGELNWASLSDFLNALGDAAQATTFQKFAIRKALTTPITVSSASDCIVVSDLTSPGAVAVTLPAGAVKQVFYIVDGKGDAGTNNITITPNGAETIGGAATLVLDHNGQSVMLAYNSSDTDWKIVANVIKPGTITPADIVGVIPASKGGTGVSNNDAATLTRSGNHALTITTTGSTGVTLPTSGTLATLAGAEALTNKNLASSTNTLTGATAGSFTNTGTVTLFTASDTVVGRSTTDTLANKTLTAPTVTGQLLLQNPSGAQPTLALSEDPDNGTNKLVMQAAATMSADYTLTYPAAVPTAGYALTDAGAGDGVLSWSSILSNPMDSAGDMIVGGVAGAATKLDHPGASGYVLATTGASTTAWSQTPALNGVVLTGASLSSNANTLDGYKESLFSSSISFAGGTTGITYVSQNARYTRIGNTVNYSGICFLSSKGSSTGGARLNLPYTVNNMAIGNGNTVLGGSLYVASLNSTGPCVFDSNTGLTYVNLYNYSSISASPAGISDSNFTNNTFMQWNITYQTNDAF